MSRSPVVAIPGRFSSSASAHRHRALSTARALSELVLVAGGEPVTVHPWAPDGVVTPEQVGARLAFAAAREQDAFDLAVAQWAIGSGTPLLAVCRGMQVVNVALGGDLEQHMDSPHRHVVQEVAVDPGTVLADAVGETVQASCYHHQRVLRLGEGLVPVARTSDGCVEGLVKTDAPGWFLAVQWHPEDTFATDPDQVAVVRALLDAALSRRH